MRLVPVILAGGSGSRFWPMSRKNTPKHVLNIDGNDTMISETIARFSSLAETDDVHIVTTAEQLPILKKAVRPDQKVNFIFEPVQRGTSACILLSAMKIHKKYGDCVICVSPSDHYITKQDIFEQTIRRAMEYAKSGDQLVTIGITPTFPSTGYGYISYNAEDRSSKAFKVIEFIEKPSFARAKLFLSMGNYLWNSGIFVFRSSVILKCFERFLPRIYDKLAALADVLNTDGEPAVLSEVYPTVPNISIDYGIMERSNDIYVVPASMGWNDIGSWDALGCIFPPDEKGNIVRARHISIDTKNCVLFSEKSLIATIGIENMIIVDCPDALLICPKSEAQRVKDIVEDLKINHMNEYL